MIDPLWLVIGFSVLLGIAWSLALVKVGDLAIEARLRRAVGAVASGDPRRGAPARWPRLSAGLTIQPVRVIECPQCRSAHVLVEGDKAKCCGCSKVWNWRNAPRRVQA